MAGVLRDLFVAIPLGFAAFDPATVIIMMVALLAGMKRIHVGMFATMIVVGTVIYGLVWQRLAATFLPQFHLFSWLPHRGGGAALALTLGALFLGYGIFRVLRFKRTNGVTHHPDKQRGVAAMYATACGFVVLVICDPPFPALVLLAAHPSNAAHAHHTANVSSQAHLADASILTHGLWFAAAQFTIFTLCSQLPLVALGIAMLAGKETKLVDRFAKVREPFQRFLVHLVTVLIFVLAALALVDGAWYFVSGHTLFWTGTNMHHPWQR